MSKKMDKIEVLKSIGKDHNHSWFEDLLLRNSANLEKKALLFRGDFYSYKEFFEQVLIYAKAMKAAGINKGDEFIAILRQTPDYPIIVAAASYIGAIANIVAPEFDKGYIADIINRANSKIVFVNDWDFKTVSESLKNSTSDKKIVILPVDRWNRKENKLSQVADNYFKFDFQSFQNKKSEFSNIIEVNEFLENGKNYSGEINGKGKLDDVIAITYTSGSTKKGFHKGVEQRNAVYNIMGRYHDPEVAGIPPMSNIITYVAVGPHADTTLLTGVSDTLMQGGCVALDPIIDENYFLYILKMYDIGLCVATRTYWLRAMKNTYTKPEFENIKLNKLYVPSEGGEPLAPGEEKALNHWLKDVKAGIDVTHTPFSITKMTVGGGDSEHGSLFLTLFRDYYNGLQKIRGIKEPMGLGYYNFVDVIALREDGTYCEPMELGRLVANSPISMKKYHNDPEATAKYFITDAYGIVWGDLSNYGYLDKWGNVYYKGRVKEGDPEIKNFELSDLISLDTKNIMSCEVINLLDENGEVIYIAHIETQFHKKVNIENTLKSAEARCISKYGDKIKGRLYFRVRTHEEGFPTLFTAKRNTLALKEEGLTDKCVKFSEVPTLNLSRQRKK